MRLMRTQIRTVCHSIFQLTNGAGRYKIIFSASGDEYTWSFCPFVPLRAVVSQHLFAIWSSISNNVSCFKINCLQRLWALYKERHNADTQRTEGIRARTKSPQRHGGIRLTKSYSRPNIMSQREELRLLTGQVTCSLGFLWIWDLYKHTHFLKPVYVFIIIFFKKKNIENRKCEVLDILEFKNKNWIHKFLFIRVRKVRT